METLHHKTTKVNPPPDVLAQSQADLLLDLIEQEGSLILCWSGYRQLAFEHGLTKGRVNKLINLLVGAEKISITTKGGYVKLEASKCCRG